MAIKRLALVVGTRPNFMKAAPLLRKLRERPESFHVTLIHTGQHYDAAMSDIFLKELGIGKPDIELNASGSSHIQTIAKIIRATTDVFAKQQFDAIIVFGDVNSTLATAISCIKQHQRLIHVEAGLRSHDRRMPEEINRVITDHISDVHFTTEPIALENLKAEGVDEKEIYYVGNIMIDSLKYHLDAIEATQAYKKYGLEDGAYVLATIHRQENVDEAFSLKRIFSVLHRVSTEYPIILPIHPRTVAKLNDFGLAHLLEGIKIIEPQGYLEFTNLLKHAKAVITDSGGVQEESSSLNIPCITLRDSTERPITVTHGTNELVQIMGDAFENEVISHLRNPKYRTEDIPLWDGEVANRIVDILEGIL